MVHWIGMKYVIVAFPGHTILLFCIILVRQMKEKVFSDVESLTSGGCTSEGGLTSDTELTSDEADRRSIIRRFVCILVNLNITFI